MTEFDRKLHWESIYKANEGKLASWFQAIPQFSLDVIQQSNLSKASKIIDIGGGDSLLVDHLLDLGYENVAVLDISQNALDRAKSRLGGASNSVQWITSDITLFKPSGKYDLWHDRAAFHFLTDEQDVSEYMVKLDQSLNPGGVVIIGTFSIEGPTRCSGLPIQQYSEKMLTDLFVPAYRKVKCSLQDHITPAGSVQNFLFCSFRKGMT